MLRLLICVFALALPGAAQMYESAPLRYNGTPLMKAKLSLELARTRVLEGNYEEAASALQAAAQSLSDFERLSAGPYTASAAWIGNDMSQYATRLPLYHDDALDLIGEWISAVNRWSTTAVRQFYNPLFR